MAKLFLYLHIAKQSPWQSQGLAIILWVDNYLANTFVQQSEHLVEVLHALPVFPHLLLKCTCQGIWETMKTPSVQLMSHSALSLQNQSRKIIPIIPQCWSHGGNRGTVKVSSEHHRSPYKQRIFHLFNFGYSGLAKRDHLQHSIFQISYHGQNRKSSIEACLVFSCANCIKVRVPSNAWVKLITSD